MMTGEVQVRKRVGENGISNQMKCELVFCDHVLSL